MLNLLDENKIFKLPTRKGGELQNQKILRKLNFDENKGVQNDRVDFPKRNTRKKRQLQELELLRMQRFLRFLESQKKVVESFIEEIKKVTEWEEASGTLWEHRRIKKKGGYKDIRFQYCATCQLKGGCSGDFRTCGRFHPVNKKKTEETSI